MAFRSVAICLVAIGGLRAPARAEDPPSRLPVFKVAAANPTADKPQSKLWFAHGDWWAWIPDGPGSSIWRRKSDGWRRVEALDVSLRNLPGRADVWQEADTVRAVLVDGRRLTVVSLRYSETSGGYAVVGEPVRFEQKSQNKEDVIETATIARDGRGRWWIAYPWRRQMWVRATRDANNVEWTEPIAVSDETDADDLCAIVKAPGGVGLAWSNQSADTMNFRLHKEDAAPENWEPVEVIERGQHNADDHINAKVRPDGTVLLATKNSVDQVGAAQLVLRVRHPDGRWGNLPYARRETGGEPSRPLLLISDAPAQLLLFHTVYGRRDEAERKRRNTIVWQSTAAPTPLRVETLSKPGRLLIDPGVAVNNVTGCKSILPKNALWIVLASDAAGNVYEGRVDSTLIPSGKAPLPAQ